MEKLKALAIMAILLNTAPSFGAQESAQPPIKVRQSVHTGTTPKHQLKGFGSLQVTFVIDYFAKEFFTDEIGANYDVCFSSVERSTVYCYQAVIL